MEITFATETAADQEEGLEEEAEEAAVLVVLVELDGRRWRREGS
ncbi:Protein of unknown function [Gryllus bimaculatus]|nr:Protein of unknown function [Gryllus bimaculatus]